MTPAIAVIIMIFAFPLLVVTGFFLIWALKTGKGDGAETERLRAEETRLIQELHQGLTRMEQRLEALETILLDRERKESPK